MTPRQHARLSLRAATAAWHERVDAVFSTADLTDRSAYGRFLQAQAGALLPVEKALDDGGVVAVLPDWPRRQRAALLMQDLATLGLPAPDTGERPAFNGVGAMLGATYVLEGSRLGGALLKRSVPDAFPSAFLAASDSAAWRDLLTILDTRLGGADEIEEAVAGASRVFGLFEASGRRFLEGVDSGAD